MKEELYQFVDQLNQEYDRFKEDSLRNRRFKYRSTLPLIEQLKKHSVLSVRIAGNSVQGRNIYLVKAGTGKRKIMLWSQMHGDEPTATAAIFDIINFLVQSEKLQEQIRKILSELELYFVPMVNPDGAEVFKRRNALDIDLNRDAARLEAPESRLLKKLRDEIDPEFGFNLHDQEIYYSAGPTRFPATISFLAPSFNKEKQIDEKRIKSMQQIVLMNSVLQKYIPNQVGRYSDDFMPTAFGDCMQLWGTSTILIESGGYRNDPEKQVARKMNFLAILASLYSIAKGTDEPFSSEDYFNIPGNLKEKMFDLLIRKAVLKKDGHDYTVDIGIRIKEIDSTDYCSFETKAEISDIGDLSYYFGYDEIDAKGLSVSNNQNNPKDTLYIGAAANFHLLDSSNKPIYKIINGKLSAI